MGQRLIIKSKTTNLVLLIILVNFFLLDVTSVKAFTEEYLTGTGKSLFVEETHPHGQSLSNIYLKSSGFNCNLSEVLEDCDPVKNVYVGDLDGNGFDEFYIVTISSGSGSYGDIIAYASDRDNRLLRIHFPAIQEGDKHFTGYMGHDSFHLTKNKLVRIFPMYLSADTSGNPTGGRRQLSYCLLSDEALWQLKIVDSVDIK